MRHGRFLIAALAAMVILLPSAGTVLGAHPGHKLVDIRAMHQPGHDRIVFEFQGGLPHDVTATWGTDEPLYVPSGLKSAAQGNAFLTLEFAYAAGHDGKPPVSTYGPNVRAYDLPNLTQIKEIEDSEAALSFAIGVMKKTWVTTDTATNPPRVIVEIGTAFDRVPVKVWFGDTTAYGGAPPFMDAVTRLVPADLVAHSTLHRLFAGPTLAEKANGLELVRSGAKDFAYLTISDTGVARVQLTGGCELGTEPISIGKEITRTLKADDVIDWVKIYDPAGETTDPHHAADSLPECLIP